MYIKKYLFILFLIMITVSCTKNKTFDSYLLVGTYTAKDSKGISLYEFNTTTGDAKFVNEVDLFNPSYLTVSKDGAFVYAISEGDSLSSYLTAYKFDKGNGALNLINSIKVGDGPCFVEVNEANNLGITADYGGGSLTFFSIAVDGSVSLLDQLFFEGNGPDSIRQSKSYLHTAKVSPDQKFIYATDLGADKIYRYSLIENDVNQLTIDKASVAEYDLPGGFGPRHIAFHPTENYLYLITELSGDVVSFVVNVDGGLTQRQVIKADDMNVKGSADIHISPDGKFLYASNRLKNDGLAIFSIEPGTGVLTRIGYQNTGIHPRNFLILPNGKSLLVANRDSDNVEMYTIKEDGLLQKTDKEIEISMPVCLQLISIVE